jgi:hypothetical protein
MRRPAFAEVDADTPEDRILEEIRAAIAAIRFGSVEIVIHESRVVLITRTEKIKVPQDGRC